MDLQLKHLLLTFLLFCYLVTTSTNPDDSDQIPNLDLSQSWANSIVEFQLLNKEHFPNPKFPKQLIKHGIKQADSDANSLSYVALLRTSNANKPAYIFCEYHCVLSTRHLIALFIT